MGIILKSALVQQNLGDSIPLPPWLHSKLPSKLRNSLSSAEDHQLFFAVIIVFEIFFAEETLVTHFLHDSQDPVALAFVRVAPKLHVEVGFWLPTPLWSGPDGLLWALPRRHYHS